MADNAQSNNGFLYFLVGALLVAVIGFGIWYFAGQPSSAAASPRLLTDRS